MLMTTKESSASKATHAHTPTHKTTKETPVEHHEHVLPPEEATVEMPKEGMKPGVIILIILMAFLLVGGFIFGVLTLIRNGGGAYHTEDFQGSTYYIIDRDFVGEYDLQYRHFDDSELPGFYGYDTEEPQDWGDNEDEEEDEDKDEDEDEDVEIDNGIAEVETITEELGTLVERTEKCNQYTDLDEKEKCLQLIFDGDDDTYDDDDDDDWYDYWYDDWDYLDYEDPEVEEIFDYDTYKEFCERWGYKQKYNDPTQRYAVLSFVGYGAFDLKARLSHVAIDDDMIALYVWDKQTSYTNNDNIGYMIVVPFKNDVVTDITVISMMTRDEFNDMKNHGERFYPVVDKPIIYLYPEEETKVSVKLGNPELLTVSYPKYTDGWNVLAEPNGTLVDLDTNRELYSLYYESNTVEKPELDEGFVVKGEDSAEFLEEKLACLGLTEREAEEFIVYWLPKLEGNNYNLIRFETAEEINKNMPLNVSPAPDTVIRVIMDYKALDEKIEVKEQVLETPTRNGFVVVEWGGSEM